MGAVGALAPTVFESMGASTHSFLATILTIPSIFKKWKENAMNLGIPLQKR